MTSPAWSSRIGTPEMLDRLAPAFPGLLAEALGKVLTAAVAGAAPSLGTA
ncbi:MAG: hypothetical protein ACREFN_17015 [Acetobacteraceae bacterium]